MVLDGAGARESRSQRREPLRERIQIFARVGVHIRADHADAETHPSLAAWEGPGVAGGSYLAAHNQVQAVGIIVWGKEVIFCAIAIAFVAFVQAGARGERAGEAASVYHDGRAPFASAIAMILRDDANDAAILYNGALHRGVWVNFGASGHGAPGDVLVDAAHVQDTADGFDVLEMRLSSWREEGDAANRIVQVGGDAQRDHITDPASAARMNGIPDFLLALQHGDPRPTFSGGLRRAESGRPATDYQYIICACLIPLARLFHHRRRHRCPPRFMDSYAGVLSQPPTSVYTIFATILHRQARWPTCGKRNVPSCGSVRVCRTLLQSRVCLG